MKKAKLKIQEAPAAPQALPAPQGIIAPEFYDDRQPWMTGSWNDLVKMINGRGPGHAADVCHLAHRRIAALTGGMTLDAEEEWPGIADMIEMNACIMHQAFQIVFDAWRAADPKHPITD
ncbi:MAG TPA: hypothetical protein VMT20_21450 [Terriglobia bacterium]|nr:hypothetical protein [Terriglobia bacterium]